MSKLIIRVGIFLKINKKKNKFKLSHQFLFNLYFQRIKKINAYIYGNN